MPFKNTKFRKVHQSEKLKRVTVVLQLKTHYTIRIFHSG